MIQKRTPKSWLDAPGDAVLVARLSVGLSLVVLLTKVALLPFPVNSAAEFLRWLLRLAIVASGDMLLVATLAAIAVALGWACASRPRAMRVWRLATIVLFQLVGLFNVASIAMFHLAMSPLTVQLLSFAGGPRLLASSIASFLTPMFVVAMVVVPLGLWLAAGVRPRYSAAFAKGSFVVESRPGSIRSMHLVAAAVGVASVALYASVCRAYIASHWQDPNRWERRIACSPGVVFFESCLAELNKSDRLTLSFDPEEVDESDFRSPTDHGNSTASTARFEPSSRAADSPKVTLPPAMPAPQNLVVIVLESVGAKHLSLYGSAHETTPQLAQLVERGGIVFDNAYAQAPSSPKGLISLAAGVFPRVDWKLITRDSPGFRGPLLPQVLRSRGYRSAYLHSGYWSWKRRDEFLSARGVDDVIDASTLNRQNVFSWGIADRELFAASLDWVDRAPGQPFHLLLWTIETHHPYIATEPGRRFDTDDPELHRYLEALAAIDSTIAWFVEELRRRGLAENTLLAITGDHGEAFGEHGQRAHSFGVFEENVHVPLVLLYPGFARAHRLAAPCQHIDVAPTCLALMGQQAPREWQGRNLLADGGHDRAYFYALGNEVLLGLRDSDWKYHYHVGTGIEQLFDLRHDPNELRDVSMAEPSRVSDYRRRVGGLVRFQRRYLAELGSP